MLNRIDMCYPPVSFNHRDGENDVNKEVLKHLRLVLNSPL